jgi:two-component system, cell cycle sensor histidine kinase and response regulator CckA
MNDDPLNSPKRTTLTHGSGEVIFVVDNEKPVLEMASVIFGLGGYKVITADNSMQAFEIYEKRYSKIDVVLLDAAMPIMDAVELSSILVDINPKVKIVVSSRPGASYNELGLRNLGVKYFLPKPFDVSTLLRTVYDVINQSETAA